MIHLQSVREKKDNLIEWGFERNICNEKKHASAGEGVDGALNVLQGCA